MKRDAEELMDTLDIQWEDVRGLITQPVSIKREGGREGEGKRKREEAGVVYTQPSGKTQEIVYYLFVFFLQKAPPSDGVSVTKSTSTPTVETSSSITDYDRMVRELIYERKARATDRLKTEEEIAREERERLIQLEVYVDNTILTCTVHTLW